MGLAILIACPSEQTCVGEKFSSEKLTKQSVSERKELPSGLAWNKVEGAEIIWGAGLASNLFEENAYLSF